MDYSIFSHSHLDLGGCKTNKWSKRNGPYQFTKGIWHNKPQNLIVKNKFCSIFSLLSCGFLVWVLPLFTSFQVSIKSKFSNFASTTCGVTQHGFSYWEIPPLAKKFARSPHLEKFSPEDSPHHQIFIPTPSSPKVNFPN